MSPRPGGEADKFGNLYEGAWTIRHLLFVLTGYADAITVEDTGNLGKGAEFTFYPRSGPIEAHQVKRQYRNANGWTARTLNTEEVLENAQSHVETGRQFHFVSTIPAPKMTELSSRASRTADVHAFMSDDWMTEGLRPEFTYLSGTVYGSDQTAWKILRGMRFHCEGEDDLRRMNEVLAELHLEGAPPVLAALGLGDLAQQNLGVRLDAAAIETRLGQYGLHRAHRIGNPTVRQAVEATLSSWKSSVDRELLQPAISRAESNDLTASLRSAANQIVVVVGTAGAGKSAVLHQAVQDVEAEDWAVLGFRLDRLEGFASTAEIGQHLGLGTSPVTALAAAATSRSSLLVIDQLDAVSLASGRMPLRFDVVADLIREAAVFPQMRVLLACRAFDVDNDHRIRQLVTDERVARVEVRSLSYEQVNTAVGAMGLSAGRLTDRQRSLLTLPLNLVLLSVIADQDDALSFTSANGLLSAFWERKRRDCASRRQPPPRFAPVIAALANAMSVHQELTVPVAVLDEDDLASDAEVLASEHVLVHVEQRYTFFHEAFFDYAFARFWANRPQDLVQFLLDDEQELFRRGQVRQILLYIRGEDPLRFVREVEALLTHPGIRFHIKAVVLALLRSLSDPSAAEWLMVERLMSVEGVVATHLWGTIRMLPWFDRLDTEGVIAGWLASDNDKVWARTMDVLLGAIKERPDRMAALIAPYVGTPQYLNWLTWIIRFANVHESRALFELVLDAVRGGDYNDREQALWMSVFGLGQQEPAWAVELLTAWLAERPAAFDRDLSRRVAALEAREHNLVQLARNAGEGAPVEYCQALIPYLRRVMSVTESDTTRQPVIDQQFSFRQQSPGPMPDLGDILIHGAAGALHQLARQDHPGVQPLLDELAGDLHESAQWLLYEALRSAGDRYADWAAELLLEGNYRFYSGYSSDPVWTTRQLLQVITPHMTEEHFRGLEAAILVLRPEWESRQASGWTSFELLSALTEERLSPEAKRRLGELRRRFDREQPPTPKDIVGGAIGSPIPEENARHMNDDQWLGAMNKHRTDRSDFETLRGGVHELSQVLRVQATNDPDRFARLALRLTTDTPPDYGNAILDALGQTTEPVETELVFDAMRHIAAFNSSENDPSLCRAVHKQLDDDVPVDIIELILDRALHSANPTEDAWPKQASSGHYYFGGDIYANGVNSARGQAALALGDLIINDAEGRRTRLVTPYLGQLAADPSVAVRSCVAHLLAGCLRHASTEAIAAYETLLATDDRLLATHPVVQLAIYIGMRDPALIEPVIQRMFASAEGGVRQSGGLLGAYAGLEFGLPDMLAAARESSDARTRQGAADLCARSLPHTSDATAAASAICQFVNDEDDDVRKAAAQFTAPLRSRDLQPFRDVIITLIASRSFAVALAQLLITLQAASDRIDEMVIACIRRFIDEFGQEAADISTSAAGEAREITQLTLRAYSQASDRAGRRETLDLIDELLMINALSAPEAVDQAER